jgi:3-hydroxyethyl bacteriochlorophyllide a dehydrogenase
VVPLDGPNGRVAPEKGVLLALAATALHGIDRIAPAPGDRLLVLGQGPVGQLAARLAQARGAWVAVADRETVRLTHAVADQVVNVERDVLADAITEPVATIVEASGSMAALIAALPLLANGGTILLLGYYAQLELPYMPLFLKEAKILTAKEWAPGDLVRCRDMMAAGTLDVSPLITHRAPIATVTSAYGTALDDPSCLKLVFDWSTLVV